MDQIQDLPSERLTSGQHHASTAASLISGSAGGTMQVLVGQPLDTIKTRAQIAPPGTIAGPMDLARRTLAQEGFLRFYEGMLSPFFGVVGVNSLLFGAYAVSKRIVSPYPDLTVLQTALLQVRWQGPSTACWLHRWKCLKFECKLSMGNPTI
ncbi:hypothetical protein PGT21_031165 [Puccinia graminis f. sp. tritici]|uniref:Uncharacterized protein n=1 Tax=Puccinia graminis f. sp. tritici TaxID=56615 RepID=A0A5B0QU34_PUCGR|nr:hypothetical protein PGT21_031165 [Puccinia graminis f. sp. tritici]KAA1116801.1 hypothetical protein PGTUg99_020930 [Puccinia graminis f. sp. tritici]